MTESEIIRPEMRVNIDDDLLGQDVIFKTFYGEIQFGKVVRQYKDHTGRTRIFVKVSDFLGSGCYLDDAITKNRIFYNR